MTNFWKNTVNFGLLILGAVAELYQAHSIIWLDVIGIEMVYKALLLATGTSSVTWCPCRNCYQSNLTKFLWTKILIWNHWAPKIVSAIGYGSPLQRIQWRYICRMILTLSREVWQHSHWGTRLQWYSSFVPRIL